MSSGEQLRKSLDTVQQLSTVKDEPVSAWHGFREMILSNRAADLDGLLDQVGYVAWQLRAIWAPTSSGDSLDAIAGQINSVLLEATRAGADEDASAAADTDPSHERAYHQRGNYVDRELTLVRRAYRGFPFKERETVYSFCKELRDAQDGARLTPHTGDRNYHSEHADVLNAVRALGVRLAEIRHGWAEQHPREWGQLPKALDACILRSRDDILDKMMLAREAGTQHVRSTDGTVTLAGIPGLGVFSARGNHPHDHRSTGSIASVTGRFKLAKPSETAPGIGHHAERPDFDGIPGASSFQVLSGNHEATGPLPSHEGRFRIASSGDRRLGGRRGRRGSSSTEHELAVSPNQYLSRRKRAIYARAGLAAL